MCSPELPPDYFLESMGSFSVVTFDYPAIKIRRY